MGRRDTYARLSKPSRLISDKIEPFLHSGLPINSLPGWELIPLNSKLPMLKCPGNQVIFSTHKIGQHIKRPKRDFNPIIFEKMPEYRPLEDDHLHDFFLRSEVLKRLKANGEITENNDVICTLKDFNQFRRELDRTKKTLDLQISMEKSLEAYDQRLVDHAEKLAETASIDDDYIFLQVRQRREHMLKKRQENFEREWQRTIKRIRQIEQRREMEKAAWKRKKLLHNLDIIQHKEMMNEICRRKIIKNKIQAYRKDMRSRAVLTNEEKRRQQERYNKLWESWQKRLSERINRAQYMQDVLEKNRKDREMRIAQFNERMHGIWNAFQEQLKKLSLKNRQNSARLFGLKYAFKSKNVSKQKVSRYDKFESFNELLDDELYSLLNHVIETEEVNLPFYEDDPLYKAAEFIKEYVLKYFKADLSGERDLYCALKKRLASFMASIKYNTMLDGQRILMSLEGLKMPLPQKQDFRVDFQPAVATISGVGYELHPHVKVRCVADRAPTPKSSLASILVEAESTMRWGMCLSLKRIRIIFIEYAYAKFRRQVLVGVQNRVLSALQVHAQGKCVTMRQDLLDISDFYLLKKATTAILSSAVDKINFDACVFLCINVMSSKIICMLQKVMAAYEVKKRDSIEMVTDSWFKEQKYVLPEYNTKCECCCCCFRLSDEG